MSIAATNGSVFHPFTGAMVPFSNFGDHQAAALQKIHNLYPQGLLKCSITPSSFHLILGRGDDQESCVRIIRSLGLFPVEADTVLKFVSFTIPPEKPPLSLPDCFRRSPTSPSPDIAMGSAPCPEPVSTRKRKDRAEGFGNELDLHNSDPKSSRTTQP